MKRSRNNSSDSNNSNNSNISIENHSSIVDDNSGHVECCDGCRGCYYCYELYPQSTRSTCNNKKLRIDVEKDIVQNMMQAKPAHHPDKARMIQTSIGHHDSRSEACFQQSRNHDGFATMMRALPACHPGFDSGEARSKALGKAQVFARMIPQNGPDLEIKHNNSLPKTDDFTLKNCQNFLKQQQKQQTLPDNNSINASIISVFNLMNLPKEIIKIIFNCITEDRTKIYFLKSFNKELIMAVYELLIDDCNNLIGEMPRFCIKTKNEICQRSQIGFPVYKPNNAYVFTLNPIYIPNFAEKGCKKCKGTYFLNSIDSKCFSYIGHKKDQFYKKLGQFLSQAKKSKKLLKLMEEEMLNIIIWDFVEKYKIQKLSFYLSLIGNPESSIQYFSIMSKSLSQTTKKTSQKQIKTKKTKNPNQNHQ
jgi:hypothetical protein